MASEKFAIQLNTTNVGGYIGEVVEVRVTGMVWIFVDHVASYGDSYYRTTVNGVTQNCTSTQYSTTSNSVHVDFVSAPIQITLSSGTNQIPVTLEFSQAVKRGSKTLSAYGSRTKNNAIITTVIPLPDWATPVTNRVEGARITATDMNRIAGNISILEDKYIAKYDYTTSDFVTQNDWNAIIEQTNEYAEELGITGVTTSSRWDNFNRIEEITKLYSEAQYE